VKVLKTLIVAGVVAAPFAAAGAAEVTGAGATFPAPVYAKWAEAYKKESGTAINYQSVGSGAGIKQVEDGTVTFGATDKPLSQADLGKFGLVQFPTVMGGVVAVVNLEGIKPGDLVLDGPTLANIYLGTVKTWNDPAIAKLNPSAKLPADAITVVHRSDGSGTTFIFTNYLSKVSPDWKKVGSDTAVEWPVGVGGKGNEGVAATVSQTKNAIGYVESAYAKQNNLTFTKLVNKDGKTVAPTPAAFAAAAANAPWTSTPGFEVVITDQAGAEAWPILGGTFILIPKAPKDPAAAAEAIKFFEWAYAKGTPLAEGLDYLPMPAAAVDAIKKALAEVKTK